MDKLDPVPAAGRSPSLPLQNAIIDLIEIPAEISLFRFGPEARKDPAGKPRGMLKFLSQVSLLFLESGVRDAVPHGVVHSFEFGQGFLSLAG